MMKKFLNHKSIPFLTTVTVMCAVGIFGFPHEANAWLLAKFGDVVADALFLIPGYLSLILLQILSLILYMAGITLNFVIQYTVVNMAEHIDGASINTAWSAIRDVANMSFIFILLYAAIRTIIGMGSDMRKTIVSVIVVAILINFSLFFTKVVIDASNVVAITFYDVIAPGATDGGISLGLASTLMEPLKLQTILGVVRDEPVNGTSIIIVGVVGSIFIMIASFILFAISIMFIIRFVVLIFVMILSPIAFLAYALPELKSKASKWTEALFSQALFAPVYFLIMWVVIVMIRGVLPSTEGATWSETLLGGINDDGVLSEPAENSMRLLMNFVIIIAFLIASLIISKQISSKGGGMIASANKLGSRLAGGASFGLAAQVARNRIGGGASRVANDEDLKTRARNGDMGARLKLATASKLSKSSFDMRGVGATATLDAGKAKKGGFDQDNKDRAKSYEKYKPSDKAVKQAETNLKESEEKLNSARELASKEAETKVEKSDEFVKAEEELANAEKLAATPPLEGLSESDLEERKIRNEKLVSEAREKLRQEKKKHDAKVEEYIKNRTTKEERTYQEMFAEENVMTGGMEYMAKMQEDQTMRFKIPKIPFVKQSGRFGITSRFIPNGLVVSGENKAKAIRTAAKGKKAKDKLIEAAKELEKEESGGKEEGETKTETGEEKTTS